MILPLALHETRPDRCIGAAGFQAIVSASRARTPTATMAFAPSVIGVTELTLSAQQGISRTFRPFEFYLAAAVLYYIVNLGMEAVQRRIERRIAASR